MSKETTMTRTLMLTGAACLALLAPMAQAESLGNLAWSDTTPFAAAMTRQDDFTIVGTEELMSLKAMNDDGTIKAIIEIPSGTSAKWEVSKDDPKAVYWELKNDKPRVINYLGYPANYGSIPGTALPKDLGGDGDPLDVIVLGQAVPRGTVADVRVIGVLKMLDGGEQDDKLIAVLAKESPFAHIESMAQLDAEYPGVSQIIDLWFANYKGPDGGMEGKGFEDAAAARAVLEAAAANFEAGR
jgi:inorganic pyrophosphatase